MEKGNQLSTVDTFFGKSSEVIAPTEDAADEFNVDAEPEEGPPAPPGRGGASRMLRGLMLRKRAVLHGHSKMRKICWSPGLRPGPRWGSLQGSPRPTSWWGGGFCSLFDNAAPSPRSPLTILSLCLSCVYVHTCMKMHCYFLLNVKHGASQLYLGVGPPTI